MMYLVEEKNKRKEREKLTFRNIFLSFQFNFQNFIFSPPTISTINIKINFQYISFF